MKAVVVERLSGVPQMAGADDMVGAGRGSLSAVLGDAPQRRRVLLQGLRRDRVLLAHDGENALGFAALKVAGSGPFAPPFAAFWREFGLTSGWRYTVFQVAERRDLRFPFYLYGMHVHVAARRQGMASALLDAVDREARASGARSVHLEVGENNDGARALYEKHGYVIEGRSGMGLAGRWLPFPALLRMRRDIGWDIS